MAAEDLTYPGEFILDKVELIGCGDDRIDLSLTVIQIDIYEDIESPVLQGRLTFTDNFGFVNTLPLVGQEHLRLKIRSPSVKSGGVFGEEQIIDRLFYVHNIVGSISDKPSVALITLEFTSVESIRNNRTVVDKILTGTYSDIAKGMLKGPLKTKKTVFVEPSSGIEKIIANRITPMDVLNYCKREAVSKEHGQATYKMFETLTGFHFRSLQSMYATESAQQYTLIDNDARNPDMTVNILAEYARIRDFKKSKNVNTMSGTLRGQFSSELVVHDIFNKDILTTTYDYFSQFEPDAINYTINTYHKKGAKAMYSKMAYDQEGSILSSATTKKFLASASIKDQATGSCACMTTGRGEYAYQSRNPSRWLQQRNATNQSLENGYVIDFSALGHTYMRAGQVVTVDLPRPAADKQLKKEQVDRFYNGPFLISAIHHKFDVTHKNGPTHMIYLRCVKDCVEEELEFTEALPTDIDDQFFKEDPVVEDFYLDEVA